MLPQFLRDMWDNASKHPMGKRKRETQIVNEAFSKKGGTWELDLKKPFFEEEARKVSTSFSKDFQEAKPRAVWAEYFREGVGANMEVFFACLGLSYLLSKGIIVL